MKVLSEQTREELKRAAGGRPYKADNAVNALLNYSVICTSKLNMDLNMHLFTYKLPILGIYKVLISNK